MDHDENRSIVSYYTLGMNISHGASSEPLQQQQQQQQLQRCRFPSASEILIALPTTTTNGFVSTTNNDKSRRDANVSREAHRSNEDFDTGQNVHVPWVVDEWTMDEEHEASTILEENRAQCRITDQDYKTKKFRINDAMAWDRFYQSHQSNFFKDRHYFVKEFPNEFTPQWENAATADTEKDDTTTTTTTARTYALGAVQTAETVPQRCLVEIGCGVGNAILPLLGSDRWTEHSSSNNISRTEHSSSNNYSNDNNDNGTAHNEVTTAQPIQWTVYGFDLSSTAIDLLRNDVRYQQALHENRTYCDVCDISIPNVLPAYVQNVAHVTSLIFCLSAIHPTKHSMVMRNVISTLQPGQGVLIFRDYGRYDLAQIKLGTQRSKLLDTDNFYRKHDGTKCYYFTIQDIEQLVQQQDGALEILELRYIRRKYINRSMPCERRRVWVQGRFRRTMKEYQFTPIVDKTDTIVQTVE